LFAQKTPWVTNLTSTLMLEPASSKPVHLYLDT
jgi:hypothetical protein